MNCSCDEVLAMLHAFVDDEADESQCAQIRAHMAECAECDEIVVSQRSFKALLARACGCEEAPPSLRERVSMRRIRVEVTNAVPDDRRPDDGSSSPDDGPC